MNKNVIIAFLGVILAASIGGNGYFLSKGSSKDLKEKLAFAAKKDSFLQRLTKLEDSLKIIAEFEAERSQFTEKISELESDKNPRIAELLAQIASLRSQIAAGGSGFNSAERKKFEALLADKDKTIEDLETQIRVVTADKEKVFAQLMEERQGKMSLEKENSDMKSKINKGAVPIYGTLQTHGIAIKNGSQLETFKAKSIQRLKVTFDVLPNQLINGTVEEEVTIRIIGPEGEVLSESNNTLVDKSEVSTFKQTIICDGSAQTIKNVFPKSGKRTFKKGNYTTELWTNGLLRQKNTFSLN